MAASSTAIQSGAVVAPARRHGSNRWPLYVLAGVLFAFFILPIYLIFVAAVSPPADISGFPKALYPRHISLETLVFFLTYPGVVASMINSVAVALLTLVLSTLIGAPAGYGLARFVFRGRDAFKMGILISRAFPIAILAVPLAVTFINWGLYDTLFAVALVHTTLALPTTVLITSSIFLAVPYDLEEAAWTLGCTPMSAFLRVVLPLAIPGIAAASIFTFVLSWNEVFAASILTVQNRTLPAQVLASLSQSPLPYRFAGGFVLIVPSMVFIFVIRRYLLNMWGRVIK
jgi:multiple sugar transport system permease protein